MKPYSNKQSKSSVAAYEIGSTFIKVKFNRILFRTCTYSYKKIGVEHVENLKSLAQKGSGLDRYISRYVSPSRH